jgi:HEAT repeat protein
MKRFLLLTWISIVASASFTVAQQQDRRTMTTKVADLLLKLPAKDSLQLKSYMQEVFEMGDGGLIAMISMLGDGDNSPLEYAIGGFTFYSTQEGKEDWRKMAVGAYCPGLGRLEDFNHKVFIISQLEKLENEEAVSCLQGFLTDEELADPAARALSSINSPKAQEALLTALQEASGTNRIPLVKALGDSRYESAVAAITPLTEDDDPMLQKTALHALAQIASPASEAVLREAAIKNGLAYDRTEATAAFLTYAGNLMQNGNQKKAEQIAKYLLKNADQANQVQYRSSALYLWTTIHGQSSEKEWLKALKSDNKDFRVSALEMAADYLNAASLPQWLKVLHKSKPEIQIEIIQMLAKNKVKEALPSILKEMQSQNKPVRLAAISAAAELGDEQIFQELLATIKKGDAEEIEAVQDALLVLPGDQLIDKIAEAVTSVPNKGQAALISVLTNRGASHYYHVVSPYLESSNPDVRKAAYDGLAQLTSQQNLPELFDLLRNSSQPEETASIQDALIEILVQQPNQAEATETVLSQMKGVPIDQQIFYYRVLGSLGSEQSLQTLASAFQQGNILSQRASLQALSVFPDQKVAVILFEIAETTDNDEFFNQALSSYIKVIGQGNYPSAQKLLQLRKAMQLANSAAYKNQILGEIGKLNTFSALAYAGMFLDESELQQDAANAVSNIALANKGITGDSVITLLKKVQAIQGESAGYQEAFLQQHLEEMPIGEGFVALFNGKDLSGWKGLVGNPLERAKMDPTTLAQKQVIADEEMKQGWKVEDGVLLFTGKGNNIATEKKYGDFEMLVDWKIYDDGHKEGDAGIYLRGTPQVQIWDTSRVDVGAQVGSGGLYNNQTHSSKPLKVADNPLGEWNNFHIIMKGDKVTVYLNGELVTDQVILENFWDRTQPLFSQEQIELQAHGSRVAYRDIYVREISNREPFNLSDEEKAEGFKVLFDGSNLDHWVGNTRDYFIENGHLVVRPKEGSGGNLFTKEEYGDFIFRFDFMLTPGANNGLGIRAPLEEGGASYSGMELQILDNTAAIYKDLQPYQYHGSVYGILPAERGALHPVGQWNSQEVIVEGPKIKVILNGKVILDGDLTEAKENGAMDGLDHPGMFRDHGHIGFLGHDSEVWFRNIRIKDL